MRLFHCVNESSGSQERDKKREGSEYAESRNLEISSLVLQTRENPNSEVLLCSNVYLLYK